MFTWAGTVFFATVLAFAMVFFATVLAFVRRIWASASGPEERWVLFLKMDTVFTSADLFTASLPTRSNRLGWQLHKLKYCVDKIEVLHKQIEELKNLSASRYAFYIIDPPGTGKTAYPYALLDHTEQLATPNDDKVHGKFAYLYIAWDNNAGKSFQHSAYKTTLPEDALGCRMEGARYILRILCAAVRQVFNVDLEQMPWSKEDLEQIVNAAFQPVVSKGGNILIHLDEHRGMITEQAGDMVQQREFRKGAMEQLTSLTNVVPLCTYTHVVDDKYLGHLGSTGVKRKILLKARPTISLFAGGVLTGVSKKLIHALNHNANGGERAMIRYLIAVIFSYPEVLCSYQSAVQGSPVHLLRRFQGTATPDASLDEDEGEDAVICPSLATTEAFRQALADTLSELLRSKDTCYESFGASSVLEYIRWLGGVAVDDADKESFIVSCPHNAAVVTKLPLYFLKGFKISPDTPNEDRVMNAVLSLYQDAVFECKDATLKGNLLERSILMAVAAQLVSSKSLKIKGATGGQVAHEYLFCAEITDVHASKGVLGSDCKTVWWAADIAAGAPTSALCYPALDAQGNESHPLVDAWFTDKDGRLVMLDITGGKESWNEVRKKKTAYIEALDYALAQKSPGFQYTYVVINPMKPCGAKQPQPKSSKVVYCLGEDAMDLLGGLGYAVSYLKK